MTKVLPFEEPPNSSMDDEEFEVANPIYELASKRAEAIDSVLAAASVAIEGPTLSDASSVLASTASRSSLVGTPQSALSLPLPVEKAVLPANTTTNNVALPPIVSNNQCSEKEEEDKHSEDPELLEKIMNMRVPALNVFLHETKYNAVKRCCKRLGWREVQDKEKHVFTLSWTDCGGITAENSLRQLNSLQKMNHFPGMSKICQKCSLALTLNRVAREFPVEYDFHPKTWCLPTEKESLKHWYHTESAVNRQRPILIVKPDGGCQGNGIFLTNDLKELEAVGADKSSSIAVQQYISNPMLIDGLKFDLRIYVLVTSCYPYIRAFQHKEGLVRFATEKYIKPTKKNLGKRYMHLTNYSINKTSSNFVEHDELLLDDQSSDESATFEENDENPENVKANKWSLQTLYKYLRNKGENVPKLRSDISKVVAKTLLSIQPSLAQEYRACFSSEGPGHHGFRCFEILGFDVMIDDNLKPWLIEVNHSPSLHCGSKLDKSIKTKVIQESLVLGSIDADDLFCGEGTKRPTTHSEQKQKFAQIVKRRYQSTTKNNNDDDKRSPCTSPQDRINRLRTCFEDSHCGGFTRILPSTDPEYQKIEAYKPPLFKERPVTMRRRLEIERSRQKMEAMKLRHRALVGDRPAWGVGASGSDKHRERAAEELEKIRKLEKLRRSRRNSGSSAASPLPRVASLGPYYTRPKLARSNQDISPRVNRVELRAACAVKVRTLSFPSLGGGLGNGIGGNNGSTPQQQSDRRRRYY